MDYNNNSSLDSSIWIPKVSNNYMNQSAPQIQNTYPNNNMPKIGLRDKWDQSSGLTQVDPNTVQFSVMDYTITVDTRDCVGIQSLEDAQTVATFNGVRDGASGTVVGGTGLGVSPIVLTLNNVLELRNGDTVTINGVGGNTAANGTFIISSVTITVSPIGTISLNSSVGNGAYTSGGTWKRQADAAYPKNDNFSIIKGNEIIVNLQTPLKDVRTLALYNINIPRDIIPLTVYIQDFITVSTSLTDVTYTGLTETNWTTFIPQEEEYMNERTLGFYSSPLDLWRSYIRGSMSMPDQITPPPLQLWNPPLGAWPNQPVPYPYQTVPTYKTNEFTVSGQTGFFYLVLAGYGVYDLLDWSAQTGNPASDAITTSLMRKLLLFLITPKQSYRNQDYIDLIINCNTVTAGNLVYPFGYGDFQRFIPGPGYNQTYQPGTNLLNPGDPTVASADSPVPFPNFRGNVCGPYSSPGDRFQKNGVLTLIQDLYLNGDLSNLFGDPIVLPTVPTEAFQDDNSFGLNFLSLVEVSLGNIQTTTNLNILNALRIHSNGFGAATIRANGSGSYYTNVYNNSGPGAGGQGPSNLGTPSAWVDHGIYATTVGGTLTDPIAQGPFGSNVTPPSADASYTGPNGVLPEIKHITSFYDMGPASGLLVSQLLKYIDYAVNDIPDTDIIIRILEAERTIRSQSTNSRNGDAMLDVPIRLNIGSANGTLQYIESIQSLVSVSSSYWEKRFKIPLGRLSQLHLTFFCYDGTPIPLEKMLQQRRSLELLRLTVKILNELDFETNPFNMSYLFDPLNPQLIGRVKRYFQIIFKLGCYEGTNPGMNSSSYQGIPPFAPENSEVTPYM